MYVIKYIARYGHREHDFIFIFGVDKLVKKRVEDKMIYSLFRPSGENPFGSPFTTRLK